MHNVQGTRAGSDITHGARLVVCSTTNAAHTPHVPGSPNALAVELVGNRFLRRMVRVLVTTAVQQVLSGGDEEVMMRVVAAGRDAEPIVPAPATGLTLAGVLY